VSSEALNIAEKALELAKQAGAQAAAATVQRYREVDTTWRDGKLEKVSDATSRMLTVQLYVDERYGSMVTSDLRPAALERFVADSVTMVRALAKDPHRKLPDPATYEGRSTEDLEIWDPAVPALSADDRLRRAKALEAGARDVKEASRILSVTGSFGDYSAELTRVTSNGFSGSYRNTYVSQSAEVSVKDDDGRRPSEWADASVRRLAALPTPESVGKEATERALRRLGAKKVASGTKTIVVEARAARGLIRHLIAPLSGSALQQKESFLEGKLGAKIAAAPLTLVDEPLLHGALGSRPFDGEGMSTKRRPIIEKGALRSYFIDTYYARKLGVAPTIGGPTNLVVPPGTKALEALIKDVKDGYLVTSFLGGNSNSTTGAFSLGIAGFRIERGVTKEPIGEMNMAGKHLDFWRRLAAVGNDPYVYSSTRAPSLVFDGVSVAGT